MKKKISGILAIVVMILLAGSNIYFIHKSGELDYSIMIGIPSADENGELGAVDFTKSKPLSDREDMNTVIFSLMGAVAAEDKPEQNPDAEVWISDAKSGICYCKVRLWIGDHEILLEREDTDGNAYEKIVNELYVTKWKSIIENQISK